MRKIPVMLAVLLTVAGLSGCRREREVSSLKAVPVREDGKIELVAATFNIRNENNGDLEDRAWPSRVAKAVRVIREIDPGVMGMQELTHGQAADLRASLPDYDFFGIAREDGGRKGEYAGIFYRNDRFSRDESEGGTFWLSGTPEKPGSATWGNTLPRVATWLRLIDHATGRGFYVFNTHFDHRHQGSREEAAVLIANRIDARRHATEPVVLLGDFNAVETNPALAYLAGRTVSVAGRSRTWKSGLVETYRAIHPAGALPRTLHLWGRVNAGWKVDHIFVSRGAKVLAAQVAADELPFSSDHFPVTAKILFP
jgi:endonuclease/exonuclease/phosphatase family metal-dependent hydrolase